MSCDHQKHSAPAHAAPSAAAAEALVSNHLKLLGFVEKRVGDRTLAEDILQDAFVRSVEKGEQLREDESAVAWLYRMLRRAIIDRHRRGAAHERKLASLASELASHPESEAPGDFREAVCQCVTGLAHTLKPEYARALERVEVEGLAVKELAAEEGISASNAGVRLFRARNALRKEVARSCGTCAEHGCLECTCQGPAG